MPQGHTHLMQSTLKLVPPTKALPIAKIKEVMFQFILEVLNDSVPCAVEFFKACKATKPCARTHKCMPGGKQPVDMVVDSPPHNADPPLPSTRNALASALASTPMSDMGAGTGADKGKLCPGPSLEALGIWGVSLEAPHTYSSSDACTASPASVVVDFTMWQALVARAAPGPCIPLPTPSTTSMLGKHSAPSPSPPLPSLPPPACHTLISWAPHDWRDWIADCHAQSGRCVCHVQPTDLEAAALPSPPSSLSSLPAGLRSSFSPDRSDHSATPKPCDSAAWCSP